MTIELTHDQIATLRDYRKQVGRKWKDVLASDWLVAGPKYSGFPTNRWHHLQRVRNLYGPPALPYLDAILDGGE
jgi:hypothetical protein